MAIFYRFLVKRDTAANFTAANTLLLEGEFGLELDTGLKKMGDGVTPWNSLAYDAITQSITPGDTTHAPSGDAVFDSLALKGNLAGGNTWTGAQSNTGTVTGTDSISAFAASGAAGTNRCIRFQTNGVDRWNLFANTVAESGGNIGSELTINRYSDAGSSLGPVFRFDRSTGNMLAGVDNAQNFGRAGARWKEIFCGNATINTSDAREKALLRGHTTDELAAALDLARLPSIWKWISAIAEKGESLARWHCSPTVQDCIAVMESHGLDPFAYGFICYDEWDETPEQRDPETDELTQDYRPAGDRYSLRPSELEAFCRRGMMQKIDDMDDRLSALEG